MEVKVARTVLLTGRRTTLVEVVTDSVLGLVNLGVTFRTLTTPAPYIKDEITRDVP